MKKTDPKPMFIYPYLYGPHCWKEVWVNVYQYTSDGTQFYGSGFPTREDTIEVAKPGSGISFAAYRLRIKPRK